MEPPCALAQVVTDDAGNVRGLGADAEPAGGAGHSWPATFGIPKEKVTVHVTLLGGGFGRKSKADFMRRSRVALRELGVHARCTSSWTREDDIRFDYYHAPAAQRMEAGLDKDGGIATAWLHALGVLARSARRSSPGLSSPDAARTDARIHSTCRTTVPNLQVRERRRRRLTCASAGCAPSRNVYPRPRGQCAASPTSWPIAAGRDPLRVPDGARSARTVTCPATTSSLERRWSTANHDEPLDALPLRRRSAEGSAAPSAPPRLAGWGKRAPEATQGPGDRRATAASSCYVRQRWSRCEVARRRDALDPARARSPIDLGDRHPAGPGAGPDGGRGRVRSLSLAL